MSTTIKYKYISITGQINVVETTPQALKGKNMFAMILMGPTGSGKSAFIESLSSDEALSISKNTLESVTQEVVCYRVVNMEFNGYLDYHYILIDTPGFLDTKLSESKITKMILSTLDALRTPEAAVGVIILYFHPITDIRMAGSKREAVMLLRAFAESFGARNINIITTMWNLVSTPTQTVDANRRFEALKADTFRRSKDIWIHVYKFEFNEESALSVVDSSYGGWYHGKDKPGDVNARFYSISLNNLLRRIDNTLQQLQQLAEDRKTASIPGREDEPLLGVINRDESVALAALESFSYDLCLINPEVYHSIFPGVPFPPHPLPNTDPPAPQPSFTTRLQQKLKRPFPFKSVFSRRDPRNW